MDLGSRVGELALELLGLCADALVALLHLGLAALQRLAFGRDARALLRQALLGLGQAPLASGEILLVPFELVLASLPLALARGDVALGLPQLLLAGGQGRRALGVLGRAPPCNALGFGQLRVARAKLILELRGCGLRGRDLVLEAREPRALRVQRIALLGDPLLPVTEAALGRGELGAALVQLRLLARDLVFL